MKDGQFENWPWGWVNVAGGPRFTEDNIMENWGNWLIDGQFKKWHLELMNRLRIDIKNGKNTISITTR